MKVWVEYYHNENRPALGDRSVVILDGRNRLSTWIEDGHAFNGYRRPVYGGFKILRGEYLCTGTEITSYIPTSPTKSFRH